MQDSDGEESLMCAAPRRSQRKSTMASADGFVPPAAACPCGGILAERVVWDGWGYTVRVICRSCWRGTRGVGLLLAEARRDAWHPWLAAREPGEE